MNRSPLGAYTAPLTFVSLLWIAVGVASAQPPRRIEGVQGTLSVPDKTVSPGLNVELRARDGRTAFHLNEFIPIEVAISSSRPNAYSIELDAGWNWAGESYDLLVSPADAVIKYRRTTAGISCCSTRRVFLTDRPEPFRYYLTDSIRFLRTGTYAVQFRSHSVFRGTGAKKDKYHELGDVSAISNVLSITILPDDPDWNAATLKETLVALDDPRREQVLRADAAARERAFGPHIPAGRGTPRQSRLSTPAATRYIDAQQALAMMDSDAGIHERVRRTTLPSEKDWRMTKGNGYSGVDDRLLRLTTRPEALVVAIEGRAVEPAFGVQLGYAYIWIHAVELRDAPQLFLSSRPEPPLGESTAESRDAFTKASDLVLAALIGSLPRKSGVAREMTQDTIDQMRRDGRKR